MHWKKLKKKGYLAKMDQLDFSPFFKTKSQAIDFCARLAILSEQIYQNTFNLEKELLNQFGMQKKDKFITLLRNAQISTESPAVLKEFIDKIAEHVTTLPVLSLTFAFEPKELTLQRLSEWFSLNTKKQVLFDISVDPTIIAGTTLTYNGKFLDYSIKPKVEQMMQQMLSGNQHLEDNQTVPAHVASPTPPVHISAEHIHM